MLAAAPRPSIHAAYDCNLVDRKNATSWLDFGWEYLDVLNFGGQTVAVQRDGAATWWRPPRSGPREGAGSRSWAAAAATLGGSR